MVSLEKFHTIKMANDINFKLNYYQMYAMTIVTLDQFISTIHKCIHKQILFAVAEFKMRGKKICHSFIVMQHLLFRTFQFHSRQSMRVCLCVVGILLYNKFVVNFLCIYIGFYSMENT